MRKYSKIYLLATCIILGSGSCTSTFDKMNVDPNNPSSITPQFLLPTGIESSIDRYWGHRTRFERINLDGAALWIQHLTRNIYSNEGDNYGISQALPLNNWKGFFNDAQSNFNRIMVISGEKGTAPNANYEGIALVMRTWTFSIITDMWGAIPYSEALKGTATDPVYTPAYDSMEKVYAGMLEDLKVANEKLNVAGPAVSGDILYSGNILKWKKFANSLRLRLANRQAAKKSVESRAIMREILSDATKYPIFTSNDDNASLKCTTILPSNNEWNQVLIQDGRTDWNLSKTLVDKMNGVSDARIKVFGNPNKSGKYEGHANGLPDAIATTYLESSSTIGTFFTAAASPEVIMTYSELQFILAEASIDGDITGDAQSYFEKGITASFSQFGITGASDLITKLGTATREKILDQKWISLFGQGIEAWTEYRRTGYPVMPSPDPRAVFENNAIIPTRLPYPGSEYSLNAKNVAEGEKLNGGPNDMKTKLWWAEK